LVWSAGFEMRTLALVLFVVAGCSLLVDENIDAVGCEPEGSLGPPACDVGEICADGRCRTCIAVDICDDAIDNDCSGEVDQGCGRGGAGGGP
jgi:hypothetical protein